MNKNLFVVLVFLIFTLSFYSVEAGLAWTTTNSFKIYESGSLTLGAGTIICQVTLSNGGGPNDCSGNLDVSTQYRVEVILKEEATTKSMTSSETVTHYNVNGSGGWAGTGPTLGNCKFSDTGGDDTNSNCVVGWSGNDVVIQAGGGTLVKFDQSKGGGQEVFMYLITTDSDASSSSTSYWAPNIDGDTTASSTITIGVNAPPRPGNL